MTVRLTADGAAALVGMTASTIRSYASRGYMPRPEPCPCCGHGATWTEQQIRDWQASRPGRTGRPKKEQG
jgi:predicted DNA-binding transcriptional regulator AlpA